MPTQQKSRICVLLPSLLVAEIKKTATAQDRTQGAVVQDALNSWFKDNLEQDAKALSEMDFSDIGSEQDWMYVQSEIL